MALNVLYTTPLQFLQRSVWHWLFPFLIFQVFVFYWCTIVGRRQEFPRTTQAVVGITQEVPRTAQEVPRTTQEVVGSIPTIQRNAKNNLFYFTSY